MKKRILPIVAGALSVTLVVTSALGAPSEAQLLKEAKVTKAQAERIALAKVPQGKIQAEELENENNTLVWSFDIAKPGSKNITEVQVNAKTGKIASVNIETPADQAKETAADKTSGQK
jgi:Peptidase propeptide and YPEB domain